MERVFFIVGPTASGKSEIAAEVARACDGEIVGADAFQVYAGLDLLTAKPDPAILARVPHHLIGTVALDEEMNAARFRAAAVAAVDSIQARGKNAFVVGGSGMYVKGLTDGFSPLPVADTELRTKLNAQSAEQIFEQLAEVDPETARTIDRKNKHRLLRALEICLLSGRAVSDLRRRQPPAEQPTGVVLFRDRAELYERINARVEMMFAHAVVEEVRGLGVLSGTAAKTLGLEQIHDLMHNRISQAECIAQIQQATRRYAKRQLTWFSRQSNFEPLNLSRYGVPEAIE